MFEVVEIADLEKRRNEVDVVSRSERERLLTFKPSQQLNRTRNRIYVT